jgi:hypothetical protein
MGMAAVYGDIVCDNQKISERPLRKGRYEQNKSAGLLDEDCF